jgi:hypothetical protein
MTKHTPEPWCFRETWDDNIIPVDLSGDWDSIFFQVGNYDTPACSRANGERIVSCVNACAGMEDPEAEIRKLRADNAVLRDALTYYATQKCQLVKLAFARVALAQTTEAPDDPNT